MAHFRKLPSGKWQAIVTLPNGRQTIRTHTLKKVVQAWAGETERERNLGLQINPRAGKLTVGQWAGEWLDSRAVAERTVTSTGPRGVPTSSRHGTPPPSTRSHRCRLNGG